MFRDLADFKAKHKAAGGHFFDKGAMAFFNSRIESSLLKGGYFITSESLNPGSVRLYSVRQVDESDHRNVETLGRFDSRDEARQAVRDRQKNN